MKKGRVVILLAGRHAGKKAVIVKQHDEGRKVSTHNSPYLKNPNDLLTEVFRTRNSATLLWSVLNALLAVLLRA